MLEDLKLALLNEPKTICNILEHFGFAHIFENNREIRCGRSEYANKTSISIRLTNNEKLYVKDYAKANVADLFSYIIEEKNVTFKEVLNVVRQELGITDYYVFERKKQIFGGFFNRINKKSEYINNVIDESVLQQYGIMPMRRFLVDGISIQTQIKFHIGYDAISQRITIPIRDNFGQLVGIKGRLNYDVTDEEESKYMYLYPCIMSAILFGYSENYSSLLNNTIVICESEKAVMQSDSMGYHNFVAIGSSSISVTQAKTIVSLMPKKIILMMDNGLDFSVVEKNLKMLHRFAEQFQIPVCWWDSEQIDVPDKANLCDLGKERLIYGMENEIENFLLKN